MPPSEHVTATVLFTDLVGSTALRLELGEDAADRLRATLDALVAEAIEAHGGRVVKGGGDGLMALFTAASDALAAAAAAQQALHHHNRSPGALGRPLMRIGLSVGDVRLEDGDCFGTPVVEAARLEAAAAPGQILCSEFVRAMARGRGGHELIPLGPLALKGLPEPVEACQLRWTPSELPDERAPLPPELAVELTKAFVGREAELAAARRLLARPSGGRLAVLWLAGEPGIGKTRLAAEIARDAHERGARVLFGRCNEDLGVPFQPFVEALRRHASGLADHELAAALRPPLARLAPELAERAAELAPPPETTPENDQYRLFEAVRSWLAGAGPLVAVFDDVHWATRPTLSLLDHVARSAEPADVVLVCTARNTAPDDRDELRRLLTELERRAELTRLELHGLGEAEVAEWVGDAALAAELHARTAGNPLYLDAARAGGSVDELARARVAQLGDEVRNLLLVAAFAGLEFDLAVVAKASRAAELAALDACEAAAAAGLLQETGADRYAFTHALVRDALRTGTSASRARRVHAALASAMEELGVGDEQVAALAHHYVEAGLVDAERALAALVRAAQRAASQFDHDEAARLYALAADRTADAEARCRLLLGEGDARLRANAFAEALDAFERVHGEALAAGLAEVAADAAIAFEDASWRPGLLGHQAARLLERALEALPDADLGRRALVTASLARAYSFSGDDVSAHRFAETGTALARACGDAAVLAAALERDVYISINTAAFVRRRPDIEEWLALTRSVGGRSELHATNFAALAAAQAGDLPALRGLTASYRALVEELHDGFFRVALRALEISMAQGRGELARAERLTEEAAQPGGADAWLEPEGVYGIRLFLLRREQDRLAEIEPALGLLTRLNPESAFWRPGLALLCAELGRLDEARRHCRIEAVAHDGNRALGLAFIAEASVAIGDAAAARAVHAELAAYRGVYLMLGGSGIALGPADRLLGLLEAALGDRRAAQTSLAAALELCRRFEAPLWEARTLCDLAAVSGDRAPAELAAALAASLDLPAIARRAAALRSRFA
ncbi:MAG: ATP-binding protein [Acidimicrobiales bacterium]